MLNSPRRRIVFSLAVMTLMACVLAPLTLTPLTGVAQAQKKAPKKAGTQKGGPKKAGKNGKRPPRRTLPLPKLIRIRSIGNAKFMVCPDGISDNALIYCRGSEREGLVFEPIGTYESMTFKLKGKELWLSYRDSTGAVKLYSSPEDASYEVQGALVAADTSKTAYSMLNLAHRQYMGLGNIAGNSDEPYVIAKHGRIQPTSQWQFIDATSASE